MCLSVAMAVAVAVCVWMVRWVGVACDHVCLCVGGGMFGVIYLLDAGAALLPGEDAGPAIGGV